MTGRTLILLAVLVGLGGCTPTQPEGGITGTTSPGWYGAGTVAPDVKYKSLEGQQVSFTKIRRPVAVVAFVAPQGPDCCWLDPRLINTADRLSDLPVTVAQFSEPTSQCPHGAGCMEACNLRQGRVMSLCDSQKLAWNAYGSPAPGTLILIGPDNKMVMRGSLSDPRPIIAEATRLARM
jgi:hypothetical protein